MAILGDSGRVVKGNPLYQASGEALLVGVGYGVLAQAGTLLYMSAGGVDFWPANGWALAYLSRRRFKRWPLLLSAVVIAEIAVDRYHGLSWTTAVGLAFANACEVAGAAWFGQRSIGRPMHLDSARKLFRFVVLLALVPPAVSAWIGGTALFLGGMSPSYAGAWAVWWSGHALGLVLITPAVLAILALGRWRVWRAPPRRIVEAIALACGLALVITVILGRGESAAASSTVLPYTVFPFVVWAGMRFGVAGASWTVLCVAAVMSVDLEYGRGPFASVGESPLERVLDIQAFVAITALTVAVVTAERQRAEGMFRSMFEAAPNAMLMVDATGSIVLVNAETERIFGYGPSELLGQRVDVLIPQSLLAAHEEDSKRFSVRTKPRMMGMGRELYGARRDGVPVPVEIGLNPIESTDGPRVIAAIVDISARRAAESALRASEERLRIITDNVPALIAYLDADQRFRFCNQCYEDWSGLTPAAHYGRTVGEIQGEAAWRQVKDHATRALAGEKVTFERDLEIAGSHRDAEISYVPELNPQGKVTGYYVLGIDITERKRAQRALEVTLAEKTVLLNEVHHRVKNNLQIISGLLYLQAGKAIDEESKRLFHEMQMRVNAMAMVHELLYESGDFSRLSLRAYLLRLSRVVAHSSGAEARGILVRAEIDDITLDPQKIVPLGLLVTELMSNAFKHAFINRAGGELTLSLRNDAATGAITLTVSDNGVGLSSDFDVSARGGVGLRLASTLADQLGGSLESRCGGCSHFILRFAAKTRDKVTA
jgi:PAS domain S-box-containing protein